MNLRRALGVGVCLYIASFIVGMILMLATGIEPTQTDIPQSLYVINIILTVVLGAIFSIVYFNGREIRANAREGFLFGMVVVVMGFVIDALFFVVFSAVSSTAPVVGDYYSNSLFWVSLVLLVITTTAVGAIRGQHHPRAMSSSPHPHKVQRKK